MPFPGGKWKSNIFFCQVIETSAQIETLASSSLVWEGVCPTTDEKFLSFHFRDEPLPPRLAQSAVYNTIEQYGIRFLVESDDTIPTNNERLACAWESSHGKEWEHGRIVANIVVVMSVRKFPFLPSSLSHGPKGS